LTIRDEEEELVNVLPQEKKSRANMMLALWALITAEEEARSALSFPGTNTANAISRSL